MCPDVSVVSMRGTIVVVTLALFCQTASAGPGMGADLTVDQNTWYVHADAESGSAWMSNVRDEGQDHYGGWGTSAGIAPPGLGYVYIQFPLAPAPEQDILLDPSGKIDVDLWIGRADVGSVYVTPLLFVDGKEMAVGEVKEAYYLLGGTANLKWGLTPGGEVIPAGSEVILEIRISGAYSGAYVSMTGDKWTTIVMPVRATTENQDSDMADEAPDEAASKQNQSTPEPEPSKEPEPTSEPSTEPTAKSTDESAPTETATTGSAAPVDDATASTPGMALVPMVGLLGLLVLRRRL